jgi:hypothetical protein
VVERGSGVGTVRVQCRSDAASEDGNRVGRPAPMTSHTACHRRRRTEQVPLPLLLTPRRDDKSQYSECLCLTLAWKVPLSPSPIGISHEQLLLCYATLAPSNAHPSCTSMPRYGIAGHRMNAGFRHINQFQGASRCLSRIVHSSNWPDRSIVSMR